MQGAPQKALQYEDKIMLRVGEIYFTESPIVIWTLLGSCLAIVFYNRRIKLGAIAHAQVPNQTPGEYSCIETCPIKCGTNIPSSRAGKFVTCSFRFLLEKFLKSGSLKEEIEVKLFGGASVLGHDFGRKTVGERNIETAIKMIEDNDLNLSGINTGGDRGRTIYFFSDTGEVYLRYH